MKRSLLLIGVILACSVAASAQSGFTAVHAIVVDPTNVPYANCTWTSAFVDPGTPGITPLINGSIITRVYAGNCDSFGGMSVSLPDNNVIAAGSGAINTKWSFHFCYQSSPTGIGVPPCFDVPGQTITGATQDISAVVKSYAAPIPSQGGGTGAGAWSSITTYQAGDIVSYMGLIYISKAGNNLNHIPTDTIWWGISTTTITNGTPFIGPNPWFDVTNPTYGAKADCSTDDTAAINLAITAWSAVASGTLYFPPAHGGSFGGCYIINGKVNWPIGLQNWRDVEMNGAYFYLGDSGDIFNLDGGAMGGSSNIRFHGQAGGQQTAFAIGPYVEVLAADNTRTKPLADFRSASAIIVDGIWFNQNSTMATEAILGGQDPASGNGMVNVRMNNGGATCGVAACRPLRVTANGNALSAGFNFKSSNFIFASQAGGDYGVSFENFGGIEFDEDYWGSKGLLFNNRGISSMGNILVKGQLSLTENFPNGSDFATFDVTGGHIDGVTVEPTQGMADNIGTSYMTKQINGAGTYFLQNLVIISSGSAGAGYWDLAGGGTCPSGTTVLGSADQFDNIAPGCNVISTHSGILSVRQDAANAGSPVLLVPTGKVGMGMGATAGTCNWCVNGGPTQVIRDPAGGSGIALSSLPGGGTGIRMGFDSSGINGLGFTAGNTSYTLFYSQSPNGNLQEMAFDHNNNRTLIGPSTGFSYLYGDHVNFPGNVQFVNNTHNGILTGNTISADRTWTFPDYNISVAGFDHTQTWSAIQSFNVSPTATGSAATLTGTGACGTITTQSGGSWAGKATCTGSTGASTFIITPGTTTTNGWQCDASDITTANAVRQSATSTTACTISGTVNANDVITFRATAF